LEKVLVYYHDDMDGICSAAIVKYAMRNTCDVDFISHDYSTEEVDLPSDIYRYWRVYILDLTLPEKTMKKLGELYDGDEIIWIDHHISAIEKFGEKFSHYDGIRETQDAACVLTWRWFYGNTEIPKAVDYIGQRDIWKMGDEDQVFSFFEYIMTLNLKPDTSCWDIFFREKNLWQFIDEGRKLRDVRINRLKDVVLKIGYESELDGHKCLKVNYSNFQSISDMGHYIVNDLGYPVAWIYYIKKNKNDSFVVINSLRSKDVDVSKIASTRGGGGHKQASGWSTYIENYDCLH
jgi:oligoribonuclease NrnB/cAMP/cGMP phosphodiesterase (DHH superfamily)